MSRSTHCFRPPFFYSHFHFSLPELDTKSLEFQKSTAGYCSEIVFCRRNLLMIMLTLWGKCSSTNLKNRFACSTSSSYDSLINLKLFQSWSLNKLEKRKMDLEENASLHQFWADFLLKILFWSSLFREIFWKNIVDYYLCRISPSDSSAWLSNDLYRMADRFISF